MICDCVVDASVAIKLFLVEPLSERADALFDRLVSSPPARFYVPDLLFVECASILWKYVRHFRYSAEAACQDLSDLLHLPFRVASTANLVENALELAVAHDITVYDAVYVALGKRLSLPVVTADEALVHRLTDTGLDVRSLAEWP